MEKKDLKPAGVFKYFEEICQVPRPSKKEEKMIAYLKAFGAKHNLETKVDEAGNVLIKKPATPGKENLQTVVLQSHIDMVCEKNNDVQHDFLTDPIETEIDGEWLKAKGTTLGADNGIGVATELAILADDSIEHGPLECLFTVDEETGLTGAFALKEGFMSGDISAHKTFFQGKCSGQSGFFIYGEQTFQRSVFYAVIGKDSQLRSHTDTIVSSECSSFGFQPFTVYFCFDWIGEEVVLNIIVFLTYHVNVRLQYYSLQVFLSGSGRLFNQYVARFIHFGLKIMFSSERL